jgi:hypothetical protein
LSSEFPEIGQASTCRAEKDVATLATGAGIALAGRVAGRGFYAITEIAHAAVGASIIRFVYHRDNHSAHRGTIGMLGLNNGVIHFGTKHWRTSLEFKNVLYYSIGISWHPGFSGCSHLLTPGWRSRF